MPMPALVAVLRCAVLIATASCAGVAGAQTPPGKPAESRGKLLYETHCIGCHTTQMHWRDNKLATDWSSLKGWVTRWETNLGLNWTEQDVAEVARHLNELYYHFPQTGNVLSRAAPSALEASRGAALP